MDALVMAGGKGTRLNMGEKPLALLLGRPLLDYVISSLEESSVDRIYLAVTKNVPGTATWARDRGMETVVTPGIGYVADMVQAAKAAGISKPFLIIMADLPLVGA
ncbi:MAG: NTP transferase domain-containing protein, partial [Methanosarcinales archaeon]|nr:NTP transferase domain-containing protein [Methanosarcinales archaeon]